MKKILLGLLAIIAMTTLWYGCTKDKEDEGIIADTIIDAENEGIITGTVIDAEGQAPINGAIVLLSPGGQSVLTDNDGYFQFMVIDGDVQCLITVQKFGYVTNRKNIMVVAGETVNVVIPMTKSN